MTSRCIQLIKCQADFKKDKGLLAGQDMGLCVHVAEWEGEARGSVGWVTLGTGFMQGCEAAPFREGLLEEYTRWGLSF